MEIVISKHAIRPEFDHATKRSSRGGAAVDQIAGEPEFVDVGVESEGSEEVLELIRTTLHVSNEDTLSRLFVHAVADMVA